MNHICKICKSPTTKWTHLNMKSDYFHCSHCHFVAKDNAIRVTDDEALVIYNKHNNTTNDPHYENYFRRFVENAILPFSNGRKVGLDFGSGPEPVLANLLMRDYGYQMAIYDLFYAPVKIYLDQKYDLITSTEVAEHIDDPLAYFTLLSQLLTDSGTLAIMTQFHQKDETLFNNWHYPRDRSHISFYTAETMAYIAKLLGLEVVYTDYKTYTTFKAMR
jgi:hypothetical protein